MVAAERKKDDEARQRGSTADFAVEAHPDLTQSGANTPASRPIKPLADGERLDQLAEKEACAEDRQEALLDEAIEETFPGSDPISPKHVT